MQQINDHQKKRRYTQSEEDPQHPTTKWNKSVLKKNITNCNRIIKQNKKEKITFLLKKKMKKQQPIDYTPTHKTTK